MVVFKKVRRFFSRPKRTPAQIRVAEVTKQRRIEQAVSEGIRSQRIKRAESRVIESARRQEKLKQDVRVARETEKIKARKRLSIFKAQSKGNGGRGGVQGFRQFATQFNENFQSTFGGPQAARRKR